MLTRRFHLSGVIAVLLALMAQLGMGATAPRIDPVTQVAALCHDEGHGPSRPAQHGNDCLICPLCAALHGQAPFVTPGAAALPRPAIVAVRRAELPPPSTAPPAPHRPPGQPRAPPTFS